MESDMRFILYLVELNLGSHTVMEERLAVGGDRTFAEVYSRGYEIVADVPVNFVQSIIRLTNEESFIRLVSRLNAEGVQ